MAAKNVGKLFVISAPSGAGKTSLVTEALKRLNDDMAIHRHTTYTTRSPRDGEENGSDFHFLSKDDFRERMQNGYFLETNEYNNQYYGSSKSVHDDLVLGKSAILVCDRNGAQSVKRKVEECVTIWVTVPDFDTLKRRIKSRGTETDGQIEKRLTIAKQELDEEAKQRFFKYHLVNDDFDRAVAELCLIIKDETKS